MEKHVLMMLFFAKPGEQHPAAAFQNWTLEEVLSTLGEWMKSPYWSKGFTRSQCCIDLRQRREAGINDDEELWPIQPLVNDSYAQIVNWLLNERSANSIDDLAALHKFFGVAKGQGAHAAVARKKLTDRIKNLSSMTERLERLKGVMEITYLSPEWIAHEIIPHLSGLIEVTEAFGQVFAAVKKNAVETIKVPNYDDDDGEGWDKYHVVPALVWDLLDLIAKHTDGGKS